MFLLNLVLCVDHRIGVQEGQSLRHPREAGPDEVRPNRRRRGRERGRGHDVHRAQNGDVRMLHRGKITIRYTQVTTRYIHKRYTTLKMRSVKTM